MAEARVRCELEAASGGEEDGNFSRYAFLHYGGQYTFFIIAAFRSLLQWRNAHKKYAIDKLMLGFSDFLEICVKKCSSWRVSGTRINGKMGYKTCYSYRVQIRLILSPPQMGFSCE